jgi:hypothetical protein
MNRKTAIRPATHTEAMNMSAVVKGPSKILDSLHARTTMARTAVRNLRAYIGVHSDGELKPLDNGDAPWGELALNIEHEARTVLALIAKLREISAKQGEDPIWQESVLFKVIDI